MQPPTLPGRVGGGVRPKRRNRKGSSQNPYDVTYRVRKHDTQRRRFIAKSTIFQRSRERRDQVAAHEGAGLGEVNSPRPISVSSVLSQLHHACSACTTRKVAQVRARRNLGGAASNKDIEQLIRPYSPPGRHLHEISRPAAVATPEALIVLGSPAFGTPSAIGDYRSAIYSTHPRI